MVVPRRNAPKNEDPRPLGGGVGWLARKHGLLTWSVRNLGNNGFSTIIEDLAVESPLPYRTMTLMMLWRL